MRHRYRYRRAPGSDVLVSRGPPNSRAPSLEGNGWSGARWKFTLRRKRLATFSSDDILARHGVAETKAGQVGSDDMDAIGKLRDQVAKHVRGSGKAVQQKDRWRGLRTRFPIENALAIDRYESVVNDGAEVSLAQEI